VVADLERVSTCSGESEEVLLLPRPLRVLNRGQIARIDRLLSDLGSYGEVRLIKVKGRLRFIVRVESEEAP
jgi:hypothetical protein